MFSPMNQLIYSCITNTPFTLNSFMFLPFANQKQTQCKEKNVSKMHNESICSLKYFGEILLGFLRGKFREMLKYMYVPYLIIRFQPCTEDSTILNTPKITTKNRGSTTLTITYCPRRLDHFFIGYYVEKMQFSQ